MSRNPSMSSNAFAVTRGVTPRGELDHTQEFQDVTSTIIDEHTSTDEKGVTKTDFGAVVRQLLLMVLLSLLSAFGNKVEAICQLQKQSSRIATEFFKKELVEVSVARFMSNTNLAIDSPEYKFMVNSLMVSIAVFRFDLENGKLRTINSSVPKHDPEVAHATLKRAMLSYALEYNSNVVAFELLNLSLAYNDGDDHYVITKLNSSTTLIHHLGINNNVGRTDDSATNYIVRFQVGEHDFEKFKDDVKTLLPKSSIHIDSIKSRTEGNCLIGNSVNAVLCALVANVEMGNIKPPVPKDRRDSKTPTVQVIVNGVTFTPKLMISLDITSGVEGDFKSMTFDTGKTLDENNKILVDAHSFLINIFGKSINGLNAYIVSYILYLSNTLPYMYEAKTPSESITSIANDTSNSYGAFELTTSELSTGTRITSFNENGDTLSVSPKLTETGTMVAIEYAQLATVFAFILKFWKNAKIDGMSITGITYANVILEFTEKNILRGSTTNVLTNMIAFFADLLGVQVNNMKLQGTVVANAFLGLKDSPDVVGKVFGKTEAMKLDSRIGDQVSRFVDKCDTLLRVAEILRHTKEELIHNLSEEDLKYLKEQSIHEIRELVLRKLLSSGDSNQLNEITEHEILEFYSKGLVSIKLAGFLGSFFTSSEDFHNYLRLHPKGAYAKKCVSDVPEVNGSNQEYVDKLIQFKESLSKFNLHLSNYSYTKLAAMSPENGKGTIVSITEVFTSGHGVEELLQYGISTKDITEKTKKGFSEELKRWIDTYVNAGRFQPMKLKAENAKVEGGKKIKVEGDNGKPALTRHSSSSSKALPQTSAEESKDSEDDLPLAPLAPGMKRSSTDLVQGSRECTGEGTSSDSSRLSYSRQMSQSIVDGEDILHNDNA